MLDVVIHADDKRESELRALGQDTRHRTTALIDTGASKIVVDYRMAERLGLRETGQATMLVVGSRLEAKTYVGVLEIPDLGYTKIMEFLAPKVDHLQCGVLLGRSFLRDFIMTFDGPTGQFHFTKKTQEWMPADD